MTTREVLFNPRVFFRAAAQSDDPWPSVTYAVTTSVMAGLVLGILAGLAYVLFGSLLVAFITSIFGSRGSSAAPSAAAIIGFLSLIGIGVAILYPVMFGFMALVGPFVTGGIQHLTLALFGGTSKPYPNTVRVVGYSHASYMWLMIPVPLLSTAAYLIFYLIAAVTGLDETHKCGVGKAIAAVVLIPAICCLCWCGLQSALAAAGASASP